MRGASKIHLRSNGNLDTMQNQADATPDGQMVPLRIEPRHVDQLKARAISKEFALLSGIRSAADNEVRQLGFAASLPRDAQSGGLQGILFPYVDLADRHVITWRLKPDKSIPMPERDAKYLSLIGSGSHPFLPHTTTKEKLDNIKVNVIITEGEFKTLAIAEALGKVKTNRETVVVGLNGVNGGWHRDKKVVETADGGHEKKPTGNPHLIDELEAIEWRKRTVYVAFDSDVGTRKHAIEFKKSRYAGAWGAEYTLVELLRARGAEVRIVEIPSNGQAKLGADDYIAQYGAQEFVRLLWNNWTSQRDVEKCLYTDAERSLVFTQANDLKNLKLVRPAFIVQSLLPESGTMIVAAAPKVGKSSLALNLARCVALGECFLGRFRCEAAPVIYIQSEIPDWAMSERLKLMGDLPEGIYINNPGKMQLNLWEEDGYQKRRETGARERVVGLINAIRERKAKMVIFDPLRHFHSLNENNVDHIAHLFEVFRGIGRAAGCGVVIVHHHRKIGRAQVKYEGAEDMSGSGALFGEADSILSIYKQVRADDTCRYKLIFDTRHSEQIDAMELYRMEGINTMLWEAQKWEDNKSTRLSAEDKILEALQDGGMAAHDISKKTFVSRQHVYKVLSHLEKLEKVKNVGNVYYLNDLVE